VQNKASFVFCLGKEDLPLCKEVPSKLCLWHWAEGPMTNIREEGNSEGQRKDGSRTTRAHLKKQSKKGSQKNWPLGAWIYEWMLSGRTSEQWLLS
jgi:hypothetical protein